MRRVVYVLIAVLLSSMATGVIAIQLANRAAAQSERRAELARQESDRRWCALLSELDDAYAGPPAPTTELGRKVAAEIHRLRVGFGCP